MMGSTRAILQITLTENTDPHTIQSFPRLNTTVCRNTRDLIQIY